MNTRSTDVAERPDFKTEMSTRAEAFEAALPPGLSVAYFTSTVMVAVTGNPKLLKADRRSLFESCLKAATDGLVPDGREGALVIYKTKSGSDWIEKVQWLPMIRGVLKKLHQTNEIREIKVEAVREGDFFRSWTDTAGEHIEFEKAAPSKHPVLKYFAAVWLKAGGLYVEVMDNDEIAKVRAASKAAESGPWVTWFDEMAKKTVLKRLIKRLPITREIATVIAHDDEFYGEQIQRLSPRAERPASISGRLDSLIGSSAKRSENSSVRAQNDGDAHDAETGEVIGGGKASESPDTARADGVKARNEGVGRKAAPPKYRDDEQLLEAWLDGFDSVAETNGDQP